jgi:hypothetical protein
MKDYQWFPPIPAPPQASARSLLWPAVMGTALGLILMMRGHPIIGIIVWGAELLLGLACLNASLRSTIVRALQDIPGGVARFLALRVLWLFYVVVVGGIHLVLAAARVDMLGLKLDPDKPSYWQAATPERKRASFYRRLYTLEPSLQESHPLAWVVGILSLVLVLGVTSECILRSMGFGSPIVYRIDPYVRYYPAPNQDVHRYGGRIHINAFGMRSQDIAEAKPRGVFRILMLGDSTLYGGSYLDQSQMYATRIGELLNEKPGMLPGSPRKVEILALGVNAWGPPHELAYVKEFGLFNADLVMVMGPLGDADRPLYGLEAVPFFAEGHRPELAWKKLLMHVAWQYHLKWSGAGGGNFNPKELAEIRQEGVAAWLEIADRANSRGALVDFEFLPNEEEITQHHVSEDDEAVLNIIETQLKNRGIPYSYPLEFFVPYVGHPRLFHDPPHLDTFGHKLYAQYLLTRVREIVPAR